MGEENISVSVRVRPLSASESAESFAWGSDGASIWPFSRPESRFTVDRVFGPAIVTSEIYETDVRPLIEKVVLGINATFFAYGQTSSGKTYTIQGVDGNEGVMSLAVRDVFDLIHAAQGREFLCRASYLEIYNEEINDLLCKENTRLPLHEGKDGDVYVGGLTEEIVENWETVMTLLKDGEENRHTGATKMNERSSRSHTIFRMIVESRELNRESEDRDDAIWVSTLNLVDLAGSERISKTGAEGLRMKEGTAINKSLLNLGIVINQLAHKSNVVSYRDSNLTRILQRSLGGNAKTAILCNITPAACHIEESSNTLRFGCRAKKVINTAHVNEVLSDEALLKRQAKEIEQLKKRLAESGNPDVEFEISQMRAALLRSEHEKELMQIKLDEEKAKKEKAERQVQVATQLMFSQEQELMLLQDRQKRRDTWCPGELSQGSAVRTKGRLPDGMASASKEVEFVTPPSAKRRMKTSPSTGQMTETEGGKTSDVTCMSTEDVRRMMRKLVEEKNVLEKKLSAASEGANQRKSQIQSMEIDLQAAYKVTRNAGEAHEGAGTVTVVAYEKLLVQLAAMKLKDQEIRMEQEIASHLVKKLLQGQKSSADSSSHVASEEMVKIQLQLETSQRSEAASREALKAKENECETLKSQIEAKTSEWEIQNSALKDLEEALKASKQQHLTTVEELEREIHALRHEREELETKFVAKNEELSVTKKSKSKSDLQASHLNKERDLHSRDIDRLKKRLEEQETKNKGLLRERIDLQNDRSTFQRQIKTLERENASLKNDAAKKENAIDKKRETLQQDLTKAKEKIDDLTSKQDTLHESISHLELQLSSKTEECEALKCERERAEEQFVDQKQRADHRSADLERRLDEKRAEAAQLKNQLDSLTVMHSEASVQLESTKEQLTRAHKALERSEVALRLRTDALKEESEFRINELTVQQELTAAENAELRKCLEEKEDAYLQLEITLQKMQEEKKAAEETMKAQEANHQKRHKEISSRLENSERASSELRKQICSKDRLVEESKQKILSLEQQLQSALDEIDAINGAAAQKAVELEEAFKSEKQRLEVKCDALSSELEASKAALSRAAVAKETASHESQTDAELLGEEIDRLKTQLEAAEKQNQQITHRLGAVEQEASEWKKIVNTTRNVEEWVKSLSQFVYELKFQSNQLLADFDEEENHIPTKLKTETASQQKVQELTEKLRSAKRAEMELYGVLRVMREDIKKAGWQPEKLDELLENSRKEYRRVYTEGKLQRLQAELQEKNAKVSKLEKSLRELKKQIPPKKLDIDLNRPPPEELQ